MQDRCEALSELAVLKKNFPPAINGDKTAKETKYIH